MRKAVQQIMLGTVTENEAAARNALPRIKAAGYDGLELNRFMIHPSSVMVRRMVCILMGCVSVWNVMAARTYIFSTIAEALYAEMDKNAKEPWPTSW